MQPTGAVFRLHCMMCGGETKKRIAEKSPPPPRQDDAFYTVCPEKIAPAPPRTWLRASSLARRLALVQAMSSEIVNTPEAPGTPDASVLSLVSVFHSRRKSMKKEEHKQAAPGEKEREVDETDEWV